MAGSAFKDPEVVKLSEKFVAILVDGDEDKEFGSKFGASGFPNTLFVDPKGKVVERVRGAVPTDSFLDTIKSAVKKIGPVPLKKAAKELQEEGAALAKAREKGNWKAALKAVAAIEKINHEGPVLEAARAAKAAAAEEGAKRLEAAKALLGGEKAAEGKAAVAKVASEFEGTDPGTAAKALLKELDAAPPAKDAGGEAAK